MTALETLVAALLRDPSRIAVEHRGRSVAAGELLGRGRGWAVLLRSAGLGEGDVLGVSVSDNLRAVELMLGAWMCGAGVLMIDVKASPRNLEEWHGRIGMRFLAGGRARSGGPEPLAMPRRIEALEVLPWAMPTDGGLIADHVVSSGSTGFPKVRTLTQDQLAAAIVAWVATYERAHVGTALSVMSLAFSASRAAWLRKLAVGKTIVALDLLHTMGELDEALARPDIDECSLPPVLVRRLSGLPPKGRGPRYPNLRRLNAVGGPASPRDKLRAVERLTPVFSMIYSATDCGLVSRIEGAEILGRPASCGRPVDGVRVEIRDGGRLCATGEIGSIVVHRADRDPVEPGDLGWLDEAGYLYVAGRSGSILCRRGINVASAQVELALMACDLVEDAVVWGSPDEDGGDRIHAAVQCPAVAEAPIAAFARRALSGQERPDRLHFTRSLARGPGGKPDRLAVIASAGGPLDGDVHA